MMQALRRYSLRQAAQQRLHLQHSQSLALTLQLVLLELIVQA
jgi:hypothetical protein